MRKFLFSSIVLISALSTCDVTLKWISNIALVEYDLVKNSDLDLGERMEIGKGFVHIFTSILQWLVGNTGLMVS